MNLINLDKTSYGALFKRDSLKYNPDISSIDKLLNDLNDSGVNYTHWKSNCNYYKSRKGLRDFDFYVEDKNKFLNILYKYKVIKGESPVQRENNDTEHYFLYSEGDSRIAHLHLYYRITTGADFVKTYYITFEKLLIQHSKVSEEITKMPSKELELIIFIVRMLLKDKLRVYGKDNTFKKDNYNTNFDPTIVYELDYLLNGMNLIKLKEMLDLVQEEIKYIDFRFILSFVIYYLEDKINNKYIEHLTLGLKNQLSNNSKYGKVGNYLKFNYERALSMQYYLNKSYNDFGTKCSNSLFGIANTEDSDIKYLMQYTKYLLSDVNIKFKIIDLKKKETFLSELFYSVIEVFRDMVFSIFSTVDFVMDPVNYLCDLILSKRYLSKARYSFKRYKEALKYYSKGNIVFMYNYPVKDLWGAIGKHENEPCIKKLRIGENKNISKLANEEFKYYSSISDNNKVNKILVKGEYSRSDGDYYRLFNKKFKDSILIDRSKFNINDLRIKFFNIIWDSLIK